MSAASRPPRWHGLLLIDKPAGLSSHDVVARIRRLAAQKAVGHTGTLDPMATGLLAVLLGGATRLEPYLSKMDKSYWGRVELGLSTDSDDVTGEVLERRSGPWPSAEAVLAALKAQAGLPEQMPPAFSAIKVAGRRAYKLARSGEEVRLKARRVSARSLDMLAWEAPFLDFRAEVSSGYYIRSLARDLGRELALGGALAALRREKVGPWSLEKAHQLDDLAAWTDEDWRRNLISPAGALPHLPPLVLGESELASFQQGRKIELSGLYDPDAVHKVLNAEGGLAGLGRIEESSFGGDSPPGPFLRPLRVLNFGF